MWNVMLGRAVGAGGLGFGVVRDEHASATKQCVLCTHWNIIGVCVCVDDAAINGNRDNFNFLYRGLCSL